MGMGTVFCDKCGLVGVDNEGDWCPRCSAQAEAELSSEDGTLCEACGKTGAEFADNETASSICADCIKRAESEGF